LFIFFLKIYSYRINFVLIIITKLKWVAFAVANREEKRDKLGVNFLVYNIESKISAKKETSYNKSQENKNKKQEIPNFENEEQYRQHLVERGDQWDKYLKDKKNKHISKESQIGKEIIWMIVFFFRYGI